MTLQIELVSWSVEAKKIINDICLHVESGEFIGLIGPNGSGKSTLLRTIYRALKPDCGMITLDDRNVWEMSTREAALRTAAVMQEQSSEFDFNVYEVALMGRNPHKGLFDRDTDQDFEIVDRALEQVSMADLAERNFYTLSGGEKQRVLIARALAQQASFLVMDEPTNHLDIRYQIEILELVKNIKVTTLAALHDLNLAALYCDRLYVLQDGKLVADGTPEDILTAELIRTVYGVAAEISPHPATGRLHIAYFPANTTEG